MKYITTAADGSRPEADELGELAVECPSCGQATLAPVTEADAAPVRPDGTEGTRWFSCEGCKGLVPVRLGLRLGGVLVQPAPAVLAGEDREGLADMIRHVFTQSHHPWRQVVELELSRPGSPFRHLEDLAEAFETEGRMGGGVACPACGKKPLDPVPDPQAPTALSLEARLHFPCPGCGAAHTFTYSWEPEAGALEVGEARDDALAPTLEALGPVMEAAWAEDPEALRGALAALPEELRDTPLARGMGELCPADVHERLDPERCAVCAQPGVKPILRRLGLASPLFCAACESVTCQEEPRVRLHGAELRGLLAHARARAQRSGATSVLPDLAANNRAFPFLVKTPPIQPFLAKGLLGLREQLSKRGGRLLSVADRAGLHLVDADTGEGIARMPHMQARDRTCPPALGFVDRKAYYQEPGELSLVAHPLYTGKAWRSTLDSPVIRILELGQALLVETVGGLALYSGATGRIRWSRPRKELDQLADWTLNQGQLLCCGDETLLVLDPAEGTTQGEWALPKRARPLRLVQGDLPNPAAVVDQGYGPGIFAPEEESFKGVKPILLSAEEAGAPDLMHVLATRGYVVSTWGSSTGYGDRSVVAGPLEKSLQGWKQPLESDESLAFETQIPGDGAHVFVPGAPLHVLDPATGEPQEIPEIDAGRGIRRLRSSDGSAAGQPFLCLGKDLLTALDSSDPTRVLWTYAVEDLQGVDVPGESLAPPHSLPGGEDTPWDTEISAVGLPDLDALEPDAG